MKNLTKEQIKKLYRYRAKGLKPAEIAALLGVLRKHVRYWFYRERMLAEGRKIRQSPKRKAYLKEYQKKNYDYVRASSGKLRGRVVTESMKNEIALLSATMSHIQIARKLGLGVNTVYYHLHREHILKLQGKASKSRRRKMQKRRWAKAHRAEMKGLTLDELQKKKRREYMRAYMLKRNAAKRGGTVAEVKQKKIDLLLKLAKERNLIK